MNHYTVWNTLLGVCVAEYDADVPIPTFEIDPEYNGANYETRLNGVAVDSSTTSLRWSAFDFLRRFTPAERVAARSLAKTDLIVEDFMDLLMKADNVISTDPDTQAGMDYLVANNVLTEARKNTILGA